MPFHKFTGSIRIKSGEQVSESRAFKVRMAFKDQDQPPYLRKRLHKFYQKSQKTEDGEDKDIVLSQSSGEEEFPCPDEQIVYKPSHPALEVKEKPKFSMP